MRKGKIAALRYFLLFEEKNYRSQPENIQKKPIAKRRDGENQALLQ
jgi:hypothetical protein